jgi:hypothetical protein
MLSHQQEQRIVRMHAKGCSVHALAKLYETHGNYINIVLGKPSHYREYTPTEEQIADACAEIRAGWADTDRQSR